jgi:DNA-binding NarL/FixJ family response regulator
MQIMLVEDNETFREIFKEELLAQCPAAVVKATASGEEALREIGGFAPQIIFMDLKLPGENGIQLTKKIKAQLPGVRIAILTSYDLLEYRQAAAQAGAERYFVKDAFSRGDINEFIQCPSA